MHALLAILLKLRGIRIGLRTDGTLRHSRFVGIKGLVKRAVLPFWFRQYDTWHPVGTLARRYLEVMAGTSRPTFLFPYNVDNAWFMKNAGEWRGRRDQVRMGMGLLPTDFVILGVMKWHPREDPLTLIDAFRQVRLNHPAARLVLVGDGPLRDQVHARLDGLGVIVCLPGYVPYSDLPKYYAMADVFAHPAVGETWGVSVNEAMACGLPVVAAEGVGAGADLIVESKTGFVFPDHDSGRLAEILVRLISDPALTKRMGRQAREEIETWSYEQTYLEMARAVKAELGPVAV